MTTDVIKMPKRFDYSSGHDFNAALEQALNLHAEVKLDCSNLEYIDSAGIGLLVMASKRVQPHNAKLVIENLRAAPREILQLANLQKIIEIR